MMNEIVNAAAEMREAQKRYNKELGRMASMKVGGVPCSIDTLHHWHKVKEVAEKEVDNLLETHYEARRNKKAVVVDPNQLRIDQEAAIAEVLNSLSGEELRKYKAGMLTLNGEGQLVEA